MNKTMKAILCLLLIPMAGCAAYPFEGWSKGDTIRQAAITGTMIVDWAQTRETFANPSYSEINPMITDTNKDFYFPVFILANTLVSGMLAPEYREKFQYFSIGWQGAIVYNNHRIGVRP
jgi:hypothetical protein